MTITLITDPSIERARLAAHPSTVARAHVPTAMHAAPSFASPSAVATTDITTNLWLGCDVQGKGFGSEYATKRNIPGRLEGMT